ncbi:Proline--tRNA ligase [uncultured archaeon]|nr:Proline--tRNA ligase [uncultured archaeon]
MTEAGDKKLEERYALKPTGETSIYPMYALWVNGLSDLPVKIYQKNWVWRHETKATKPFIRGREFLWIEAHDVFATAEEMRGQIVEDVQMGKNVMWKKLGIPFIFFRRPQWDKFAGADDTFAADTIMPDGKVLQIATTHLLGRHFSKAFGIKYMNEKNEETLAWQTTYGPGISRIYAATVCVHGDDKGMVLPYEVAPVQVVIVPILRKDSEEKVLAAARELGERIRKIARVQLDARSQSPGFKFNHWEQRGVPLRIEIGERDMAAGTVVLASRDNRGKRNVPIADIEKAVAEEGAAITGRLMEKSSALFKKSLDSATDADAAAKKIEEGRVVKVPFCSDQMDGEKCAKELKEKYSCDVRGTVFSFFDSEKCEFESSDKPHNEKCINCGKPAKVHVYVARQY